MGPNSALLLKLVPELRRAMEQEDAEPTVQSTGQVGAYLVRQLADVQEEAVFMFCIDGTGRPVRSRRLTEGGSFFDLRDLGHRIVESAVLMGAQYVVLAHCQLDECFPDNADYGLADFALRALKSVDVQLLDYDLVSGGQYISLRDSGFLYGL